jgi:hypothetical protein
MLLAIFEDERRPVVEETGGEDREHPGVGIRERLAGAEHVEEAEGHGGHAIGAADHQRHALLIEFRQRVDRRQGRGLVLGGRQRHERRPFGVPRLPVAGAQLPDAAFRIVSDRAIVTRVEPFSVETHARRNDQSLHRSPGDLL